MSVRRLAEDATQPESFAFTDENEAWAQATIRKYPEGRQQSAVIPLLMRAQDQEGWVTKAAIVRIADMLAMPLIRVLEVATFYTQFQLKPVGTRAHVQVCGTTPCMLRGAEDLKAVCRSKIHPEPFHRNESGTLSWEEVECLGACVNAPMVMVFEDTYEDLTPERLEEIIDLFDAGRGDEVKPGPQNGRHLSVPIGGLTSLTGDYDDLIETLPTENAKTPAKSTPAGGRGGGKASQASPTPSTRADGILREQEAAARESTVPDVALAEGGDARESGAAGAEADLSGRSAGSQLEGQRGATSDTTAGPMDAAGAGSADTGVGSQALEQGEKPAGLLAAPEGAPDDLKQIKGIGPVIEAKLNELGVFHFRQIAEWRGTELVWVDNYLNFRGRAVRDDWIGQAKQRRGGSTEVKDGE